MEDISVIVTAFNEEKRLPRFFNSLHGIKDIVLINHLSTDNTKKLAEKLGARVITQPNRLEMATEKDVLDFEKQYGYKPRFKSGDKLSKSGEEKNETMKLAKNDWVYYPDCDEIVTWNLEEIKKLLPLCDKIEYKFIHSHNLDGSPEYWFKNSKLVRRSKYKWVGRVHEVLVGDGRIIYTDKMIVNHYRIPSIFRTKYLPGMEFAVLKDNDTRTKYYLAREYYYYKEYEKAIFMFKEYFKTAWWRPEVQKALIFMTRCFWESQRGNQAREYCLKAIGMDPGRKEALELMAEMSWEKEKKIWKSFAEQVKDEKHYF